MSDKPETHYTLPEGAPIEYPKLFQALHDQTPTNLARVDVGFRADAIKIMQKVFSKLARLSASLEQARFESAQCADSYVELVNTISALHEQAETLREHDTGGNLAQAEYAFMALDKQLYPEEKSFTVHLANVAHLLLPYNQLHLVRKDLLGQIVGMLTSIVPEKANKDIKGFIEDARMADLALDIIEPTIAEHATASMARAVILETAYMALRKRHELYLKG